LVCLPVNLPVDQTSNLRSIYHFLPTGSNLAFCCAKPESKTYLFGQSNNCERELSSCPNDRSFLHLLGCKLSTFSLSLSRQLLTIFSSLPRSWLEFSPSPLPLELISFWPLKQPLKPLTINLEFSSFFMIGYSLSPALDHSLTLSHPLSLPDQSDRLSGIKEQRQGWRTIAVDVVFSDEYQASL